MALMLPRFVASFRSTVCRSVSALAGLASAVMVLSHLAAPAVARTLPIQGGPCTPGAIPTFGVPPGTNGQVLSWMPFTTGSGTALYAGGQFTSAGGVSANNIARWDGQRWLPLGSGIGLSTSDSVEAMEVFDFGTGPQLFVAGRFNIAGGVAAVNIARWDGSQWHSLGLGTNGIVRTLEVFNDGSGPALYVGGSFSTAGGVPASRIAKWKASGWSAIPGTTSGDVYVLRSVNEPTCQSLYAGGAFSQIGGTNASRIARFCSSTGWRSLASGASSGLVRDIEVYDDGFAPAIYVGGTFGSAGGVGGTQGIAKWDEASGAWSSVGGGFPSIFSPTVYSLRSFDDGTGPSLYLGGSFILNTGGLSGRSVARWNGSQWSAAALDLGGAVYDLTVFDDGSGPGLYIGGFITRVDALRCNNVARYSLQGWRALGGSSDGDVLALGTFDAGAGESVYVAGSFTSIGSVAAYGIARWDGQSMSSLDVGVDVGSGPPSRVYALTVHDDGGGPDLYIGGDFTRAGSAGTLTWEVARWDGSTWSGLGGGPGGDVLALASFDAGSGSSLIAGGTFDAFGSRTVSRWTGSTWSSLGAWASGTSVRALATFNDGSGNALYAGGSFTNAGGVPASNIARWNGSSWSAVGAGLPGQVNALYVFDDGFGAKLYAGGSFQGGGLNRLARWNGTAWTSVGGGVSAAVNTITAYDDGNGRALYVGGDFTLVGPSPALSALRVAKWTASGGWASAGSWGNSVKALGSLSARCGSPSGLYIGGQFINSLAFDNYLARWGCPYVPFGTTYCTTSTTTNGCLPRICGVGRPSASAATDFAISVSGVEGQKQGIIFYGINNSGFTPLPWGSGFFCVKSPTQRAPTQTSGGVTNQCNGQLSLEWNGFLQANPGALGTPFSSGQTVYAQAWMRDPPSPKTTVFSDGLSFVVQP